MGAAKKLTWNKKITDQMSKILDANPSLIMYGLFDYARTPRIAEIFNSTKAAEAICLYECNEELRAASPHLIVDLTPDSPVTHQLLSEGYGDRWGIYFFSDADPQSVMDILNDSLMIQHQGKKVIFRYYDPSVFTDWAVKPEYVQWQESFFKIVNTVLAETKDPSEMGQLTWNNGLKFKKIPV